jgi:NADPH2 dehydrogenase
MASQTASQDGFVTEKTIAHYNRLAEAKPGLLIVEYTFVHFSGRSEDFQLGVQSDAHIDGLSRLAQAIKKSGALAGLQITHGGGKSERSLTGGALMGPSAVSVPVKDRQLENPDPMNTSDIELWKFAFVDASDRAVAAGFDLIELHSAHGYGLNQWLSPITNQRTDDYGGDLNNRMRLLLEIIEAIRARHPRLLISVRMPGQDFIEDGLRPAETVAVAQAIERAGVDIIHVSSGIGGWRRPSSRTGEGYLVPEAADIQANVRIPVIGVGGIETGTYIDESLQLGRFALAAVGRAILKDPSFWNKTQLQYPKSVLMEHSHFLQPAFARC